MKKRAYTIVLLIITLLAVLQTTALADTPKAYPAAVKKLPTNGLGLIAFKVFPEYKNEILYVNVYKGTKTENSNLVFSDSKVLENYSTNEKDVSFLVSTKNWSSGTYTVEYFMEYYSVFEWRRSPFAETYSITVTKPCQKHNWTDYRYYTIIGECSKTVVCKDCGVYESVSIPHTWEKYTTMYDVNLTRPTTKKATCKVCKKTETTTFPATMKDVSANSYYENPVIWAYNHEITKGTTASTFSPNQACTRGEIITFLYRACGSPEVVGKDRISDISKDDFYFMPVRWAKENGLFDGDMFYPKQACTRAMAVEFMWKYSKSPKVTQTKVFSDVASGTPLASAVAWAVDKNITNGTTETTFSPDKVCSRAEIATFLFRGYAETGMQKMINYITSSGKNKVTAETGELEYIADSNLLIYSYSDVDEDDYGEQTPWSVSFVISTSASPRMGRMVYATEFNGAESTIYTQEMIDLSKYDKSSKYKFIFGDSNVIGEGTPVDSDVEEALNQMLHAVVAGLGEACIPANVTLLDLGFTSLYPYFFID